MAIAEYAFGRSRALRRLLVDAHAFARSVRPVIILGETGTGKTRLARAMHEWSERNGPFVKHNCATMPEGVLASGLIGHQRGAFTGADRASKGLFELAQGGTLFLDELADASHQLQTMLVGFLDDGIVRPLGAERTLTVSTRLIAATNADLDSRIAQDRFRADLRGRFGPFALHVPPLRERRDEIIPIASAVIRAAQKRQSLEGALSLTGEAERFLREHHWPGNIRELELYCEVAALRATARGSDHINLTDLLGATTEAPTASQPADAGMWQRLRAALEACGGNRTAAARRLGVSRQQLYRLLDKHQPKEAIPA